MIVEKIEPLALKTESWSLVLCRVTTTSGIVGWGESLCLGASMQQALVATLRDAIAPHYIGKSAADRDALNLDMRRRYASFGRAGTVLNALSAVDIALWDIAGKSEGRSVSDLLGGAKRASVPLMASLAKCDDKAKVRARLEQALAAGVKAAKVHEANFDVIEEARAVVPRKMPFIVDSNNAHTLADVRRDEARWRALGLLFFEDPFWPPEDLLSMDAMPGVPFGMGADLGSAEQIAVYAKAPAIAVLQPDVCMLGGIGEARRAVKVIEAAGRTPAPHTPFIGPAALASLHLLATAEEENYFAALDPLDGRDLYGKELIRWRPSIDVPTGPGLGWELDEGLLRRYAC
ncbi:mandelate racemase/muconate lactonizing enzyme family protein [Ramlibacter sp.]|uniref:mandelate racemase/muconate lactonizing enzyme family protein n=1 Tax=Ramlibacter sp. TaxID=1917967 RepID=UPI003D122067